MPNRLSGEKSLYLRQHAHQPVDWWPWCGEAFAAAREADKPIIVSIGYSACHWCHVMARECFDDPFIADLMNDHFICIKVDREERPDIDHIYMQAVQMITQRGGWPLHAFLLPDGRPFFGGTYFPPRDTGHGIIPWPQLLMRVSDYYRRKRSELEENAENIIRNLEYTNQPQDADGRNLEPQMLLQAAERICSAHDDEWGGFGDAPKFPPSMVLDLLLALRATATAERHPRFAERLDFVLQTTLSRMALGGLYDQLGGGFCRYSVDRFWRIPHFEKMLCDNGLLAGLYSKAWRQYRNPLFRDVASETVEWLFREMCPSPTGFATALAADSEGHEGAYYTWTPEQIAGVLGAGECAEFCDAYGITAEGNFENGGTHLNLASSDPNVRRRLADARSKLLAKRQQRIAPDRDDKILLSWNSLALQGIAEAAFAFGRKEWLQQAIVVADRLWNTLADCNGRVGSVILGDTARPGGFLDDYAFFAECLLTLAAYGEWAAPGSSAQLISRAETLANNVLLHFDDNSGTPGFFFTADDGEQLATRRKEWFDNAIPCGNSAMIHVFSQLSILSEDPKWREALARLQTAYPGMAERMPNAVAHALSGFVQDLCGIAVLKYARDIDADNLQRDLACRPWRRVFLLPSDDLSPATVQLCVGTQCMAITGDIAAVMEQIAENVAAPADDD